ncbi:MAG: tetratricopeptide repeat protein [Phycisphaerae bacterium]
MADRQPTSVERGRMAGEETVRGGARGWACAAAIVAVALAARLGYVSQIRGLGFCRGAISDAAVYVTRGREIAAGDWLGPATFVHAPTYAYLVGLVFRVMGEDVGAVRGVQALVGALTCALVAAAAANWLGRAATDGTKAKGAARGPSDDSAASAGAASATWVGLAAGLGMAVYPPAIFFDGLIQKAGLEACLAATVWWLMSRRRAAGLSLGVTTGLLALTRQQALVVAPLVAWVVWRQAGGRWRRALALFAVGLLATMGPWVARNRVVLGEWVLTTPNFGQNFAMGNHPEATGTYLPMRRGAANGEAEQAEWVRMAERATGRRMSAGEVSAYYAAAAWGWVRENPAAWGRLLLRKLGMVCSAYEAYDTEDYYLYAERVAMLGLLERWFHFGVLLPLGAAGAVLAWRRRGDRPGVEALVAWIVLNGAAVALFVVFARYRVTMIPALMMLAGYAAVRGVAEIRRRSAGRVILAGVAAAVAAVVANGPGTTARRTVARSYVNHAQAWAVQGMWAESLAEAERAVRGWPNDGEARVASGDALLELGRAEEAVGRYEAAMSADAGNTRAASGLGNALLALGRLDEAEAAYRRAAEAWPGDRVARRGLASVTAQRGRLAEAAGMFEALVADEPGYADGRVNLGNVYAGLGRMSEAEQEWEWVAATGPGSAAAFENLYNLARSRGDAAAARRWAERWVERWPGSAAARSAAEESGVRR